MKRTTISVSEEIKEALDELKEHPRETYEDVLKRILGKKITKNEEASKKVKKDALDILKEKGFLVEFNMNLKNTDAFFRKLERAGVRIIETTNDGRIAINNDFYQKFWEELNKIDLADDKKVSEALSKTDKRFAELFKVLRNNAIIYFDVNERKWKEVM